MTAWIITELLHRKTSISSDLWYNKGVMKSDEDQRKWNSLSYKEKNHELYLRQVRLLDTYLKTGAISQEQHDKSLHDLTEKMRYKSE